MNPYVLDLLYELEDPILFEFGCHMGQDTQELARFGFSRFYAFEPDPRNIAQLEKQGLPPGVNLVRKAIGDRVGRATLYQSTNILSGYGVWTASNSIRPPAQIMTQVSPELQFNSAIEVDVTTLDAFCEAEGIERIDLIWADIQGAERDLIAGGTRMIPRTHYLFMEQEAHRLYEGQWLYEEMVAALPQWKVLEKFPHDVLLENLEWKAC